MTFGFDKEERSEALRTRMLQIGSVLNSMGTRLLITEAVEVMNRLSLGKPISACLFGR